jgi:hypothetical protein
MPFIGNKPSAVPLTSADIADGIITSAKIVDGTIVNADINASAAIASTKLSGITSPAGFRNIVINGDMQIAQRSTSVASITTTGYYTLDRYQLQIDSLGTWTMSQSTDVPTGEGFAKSLKLDCTTADATPSATDYFVLVQKFEGQNLQYLKKGTANAVSLTLSFWVKSTKTGTFIIESLDNDNSRSISKSYTVNTTNTWEKKTITFAGDTTGAFDNDNGTSLIFYFWLGAGTDYTSGTLATSWGSITTANKAVGQVNIADSTSNDFLITGVQLEAGTSATDFEFLPIDVSLDRCQRYYTLFTEGSGTEIPIGMMSFYNSSIAVTSVHLPTLMRVNPTLVTTSGTNFYSFGVNGGTDFFDNFTLSRSSKLSVTFFNSANVSGTAGHGGDCWANAGGSIAFNAEL